MKRRRPADTGRPLVPRRFHRLYWRDWVSEAERLEHRRQYEHAPVAEGEQAWLDLVCRARQRWLEAREAWAVEHDYTHWEMGDAANWDRSETP